jgi:hypothetical protein
MFPKRGVTPKKLPDSMAPGFDIVAYRLPSGEPKSEPPSKNPR